MSGFRETGDPHHVRLSLFESEWKMLQESDRCENCRHLDLLHDSDRDYGSFCTIEVCECEDDRFPDEWTRRRCDRCQRVLPMKVDAKACEACTLRLNLQAEADRLNAQAQHEFERGWARIGHELY